MLVVNIDFISINCDFQWILKLRLKILWYFKFCMTINTQGSSFLCTFNDHFLFKLLWHNFLYYCKFRLLAHVSTFFFYYCFNIIFIKDNLLFSFVLLLLKFSSFYLFYVKINIKEITLPTHFPCFITLFYKFC